MAELDELIDFIETNPPPNYPPWKHPDWKHPDWEKNLTRSVPNWRSLIAEAWKDPHEWERIENARPTKDYDHLCWNLVSCIGLELAKKWFYSDDGDQQKALLRRYNAWLFDNIHLWSEFDSNMKDAVLTKTFEWYRGQPFEALRHLPEYYLDKAGRGDPQWPGELSEQFRYFSKYYTDKAGRRDSMSVKLFNMGYVPSRRIERLRNTIQEAGDAEYLAKIDEMISEQEKACQSMAQVQQAQQRIPYHPNGNERELIARLMEITGRSGYLPAALPPILLSSETPPLFVAYPELEEELEEWERDRNCRGEAQVPKNRERRRPETVSMEELFGVYQPRQEQIIIYERGIRWRARQSPRLREEWLFTVVLVHEIGHWITHVLPKPGVPAWATDLYVNVDINVHEGWAQLMTWWVANQVGGQFKKTFEELNERQSSPYKVFEQFKGEPIDRVMASLEKLRSLQHPAQL